MDRQEIIETLAKEECDNTYNDIWDTLPDEPDDGFSGRNYYREVATQVVEKFEAFGYVLPVPQGERREQIVTILEENFDCRAVVSDGKGGFEPIDVSEKVADSILQLIQPVPEIPLLTDRQIDDIRMAVFPQLEKTFKRKWSDVCGDIDTEQFLIEITDQTGMKVAETQRALCLAALKQGRE